MPRHMGIYVQIYIYVYVYIHIYIHIHTYTCICVCVCTFYSVIAIKKGASLVAHLVRILQQCRRPELIP